MSKTLVEEAEGDDGALTTWQVWQRLGYDKNSILADPNFVDPDNDDYTLQPDSPAQLIGSHFVDDLDVAG